MTQSVHAVDYQRRNGVAVVTMNNPPVNGLSQDRFLAARTSTDHGHHTAEPQR
jgi:hypothetical protein